MKKVLLILFAALVGVATLSGFIGDSERREKIDKATTPEQLAAALVDSGRLQVTLDKGVLVINRTVDSVLTAGTAVSGFNINTARLVPAVFAKFPQVDSIVFRESGPFRDIRGNESTQEMLRISFMKADANQIHWDRINYDDLPKLGEHYWMHPGLRRALEPSR
ncbi:hypothetical protein [Bradyrhizobium sp. Arg816]|uniref:hypothetical protein n=1 Tax=Bradyrhizobium sp. Arg816 TaxID=2998491 RepID=UPI00249F551B|nr:hypothetical protein [Bradyrhizobium sp. Arg816]MDI3561296.1 hypothetical protein [Bradyrhizobium sp. Arg816]